MRAKVKRRDYTEVQDMLRKMVRRVAWSAWQQDASSSMLAGPDAFRYPQHEWAQEEIDEHMCRKEAAAKLVCS